MNETRNGASAESKGRLAEAIREAKTAAADREDVVVELREAARMRLELLAQELEPVFADVPADDLLFDFAISSGTQPRLWIDAVSHVAMGRDRRTFRFVRDTRLGRTVLAESTDMRPVADQVTRYIAERMIERQRWLDGPVTSLRGRTDGETDEAEAVRQSDAPAMPSRAVSAEEAQEAAGPDGDGRGLKGFLSGMGLVLGGAALVFAVAAAIYWDRLAAYVAAN
ncbi:hypothetical protein FQ775_17830 [Nitratireductor mangrovi]|uniref:Uncharacterized protein n=1 Tax=Nitratireductor mangrovi TaxID=2599600 RepID=A0A5B8L373_9HYPH|nr:hypothetical protein [Nitratireductor mangrovi]QDZ02090.1 hypothetical protein FQ775_17830 [Nitratireductor mangrovi]